MASLSRKISASTNFLFFVLIIVGFLVLINFLAMRHFGRLDLTQNKLYTLSDSSMNVASTLDDIVKVTCYFSKNLPSYVMPLKQQVNDILDEYRAYAKGNIQIEFLDPTEDPALAQKLRFMGIPQVQLNIMEKDQASATNVYMGVAVSYEDKQEVIPFVKDVNNLEYEITSSILKVTRKEKKTVGFLTGHEEHTIYGDYQTVHKALTREYEVEEVNLSSGQPVPNNINVLVVAGPTRLTEGDKYEIDQYIMKGGKVVFLIDIVTIPPEGAAQASYRETNLIDMLENYGVRVTKNLVLDRFNMLISFQTGYTILRAPYPFYVKVVKEENGFDPDNPIVNQFSSMVFPWVSALEPLKDSHKDLQFTVLVQSSRYSWLQKGMYDLSPLQQFMPQPEDIKPYPLAMLVNGKFKSLFVDKEVPPLKKPAEEGKTHEEKQETIKQCEKGNQILVVANARFINDNYAEIPGNIEFFLNAVDWFTWGKDLIGVRSRLVLDRTLPFLSEQQKTAIRFANLGGIPILLALFGIVRFYIRKKKKITLETLK
jgi:gliding-associated putative ABC transporter substrate-binding component GldG